MDAWRKSTRLDGRWLRLDDEVTADIGGLGCLPSLRGGVCLFLDFLSFRSLATFVEDAPVLIS